MLRIPVILPPELNSLIGVHTGNEEEVELCENEGITLQFSPKKLKTLLLLLVHPPISNL